MLSFSPCYSMNNKDFAPTLVSYCLLSYISAPARPPSPPSAATPTPSTSLPHFLHRGLLRAVSPHACWTVPMLCPLPPHLLGRTPARTRLAETTSDGQRAIKGAAVTETVLHSGALCTVLIMISFVSPMSLTPLQLWAFQAAPSLSLYSLFFFGSKKYLRL